MNETIKKINDWGYKNEINKLDPRDQLLKITEEIGELCSGICKNDEEKKIDSIGDVYIAMSMYCLQRKIEMTEFNFEIKIDENKPHILSEITSFIFSLTEISDYFKEDKDKDNEDKAMKNFFEKYEIIEMLKSLIKISVQLDLDFEHCVKTAFNEIENRNIKIKDGFALKELKEVEEI